MSQNCSGPFVEEQRLQTTLTGEKRAFLDKQIDQELAKSEPDKEVVGSLLEKAIKAAKKVDGYMTVMDDVLPSVVTVTGWLGASWQHLARLFAN